jgi:hypothetical protein
VGPATASGSAAAPSVDSPLERAQLGTQLPALSLLLRTYAESSYCDGVDDLQWELARIKTRRAELRSAEFNLAKQAREVAARALAAKMPPEVVAQRLGYSVKVIRKWQKMPIPTLEPAPSHDQRWAYAERAHDRKLSRRQARLRRALSRGGRDGWRKRSPLGQDEWVGDCNM